jgi:periplasmic protein TonB
MIRRILPLFLFAVVFSLGVFLAPWFDLDCALARALPSWGGPLRCAVTAIALPPAAEEDDAVAPVPVRAATTARVAGRASVPEPVEPAPDAALSASLERGLAPSLVVPPRAEPRLDPISHPLPVAATTAEGANAPDYSLEGSATAPLPLPVSLTPTSVPVPRDPAAVERLLEQRYPPSLRGSGLGGTVVLALEIDRGGRVRSPEVVSGSGHEALDDAAVRVARELRFTPARQEGRTIEARILFPVVFRP